MPGEDQHTRNAAGERAIATEEGLNGYQENITWRLWRDAMMSRRLMNIAGAGIKNKVVNKLFSDSWGKHRGELKFAERSFNKMWKDRQKH